MNIIIHFFNYDLTRKVIDNNRSPSGYYTVINNIDGDSNDQLWYYHGVDPDGLQYKKYIEYKEAFDLETNMTVFEW